MKKICFVVEYMYCGGVEKSILSLLQFIDRRKYEITILLMKKKGDLLSELPNDIEICEIPFPEDEIDDLLMGHHYALNKAIKDGNLAEAMRKAVRGVVMSIKSRSDCEKRLRYYKSIEKKIAEYPKEFDVVIDYMGYGLFNTFYAARKVRGKVKISWVHFEPYQAIPDFDVFYEILDEYQHIMCVSENTKKQMKNIMPKLSNRYHTFYNIVDSKDLHLKAQKEIVPKKTGEIAIVSIGRLDPPKGFDLGIVVIERLFAEGYPVKWYIVGEGWQREILQEYIEKSNIARECVVLLGQKLNPYPYIDMCDIYFQPSRHEGYGIALAEARAFNKPIVATDFAGAKEQLVEGKTGLITTCSEEGLYQALKQLLDNCELREEFSKNLEAQQEQWPSQVKFLEEIFEQA